MFIYQYLKLMLGIQFYKLSMTPLASYIVILAPTTFYMCLMNQATLNASSLISIMLPPSGDCSRLRMVCFVFVFWSSCVFTCSQCSQGTPPFMALEIMLKSGKNVRHELRHDLESLLYVVFWLCNHMIAPGVERELVDKNTPYIRGWCNMALSLQGLGHLKLAHIVDAERTILAEFTPYWEDFKPFAKHLLAEFFPVSAANPNKITSAKMLEILNEALSAVKVQGAWASCIQVLG